MQNMPEECPINKSELDDSVVDHCHETGEVRGVLHRQSNAFLGKIENAWKRYAKRSSSVSLPDALRNMADYIENSRTGIMHPTGATQLAKRFAIKKMEDQINFLLDAGFDLDSITNMNSEERTKLYRKNLTKNKYASSKNQS